MSYQMSDMGFDLTERKPQHACAHDSDEQVAACLDHAVLLFVVAVLSRGLQRVRTSVVVQAGIVDNEIGCRNAQQAPGHRCRGGIADAGGSLPTGGAPARSPLPP